MIELIQGDCLEKMKAIPDNSVDCVITDPPYYGVVNKKWDNDWKTRNDFINWLELVVIELKRVMKSNGSLYIFAGDKNCAYVQVMIDRHLTLLNNIVWHKTNNLPIKNAHLLRTFAPMTERILFYTSQLCKTGLETVEKEYIAPRNPFAITLKKARLEKGASINQVAEYGKFYGNVNHGGAVTNWERGYNVPTEEQWKILCDHLPIKRQEYESLRQEYESLRRIFNAESGCFDVITSKIITAKENTAHPTTKPERLVGYFATISTNEGCTILDPFMGSGTTGVGACNLNRNFIGIEKDPEYFQIAKKRIEAADAQLSF